MMTSHMRTGNFGHHTPSSFADVGITSLPTNTCQWMIPTIGISQQSMIQYLMGPYAHGGLCEQTDKSRNRRHVTVEILPENTLLEIFDFYRLGAIRHSCGRPWKWHRLAHVCQKWRHVVQTSPRRLGLQIYCKSGRSVERILDVWPTLPLVVRFKGTKKFRPLPENVVIALRHPDRVCKIDLEIPGSIIGSITKVVQEPFLALKSIHLRSTDGKEPPILGEFLGGSAPLLEDIMLSRIAVPFPALRRVLLSTDNLVELWLLAIPNICYFSPETLVTCLSALVQLRELCVGFHSPASRPAPRGVVPPPPLARATLPSLSRLFFHGASEYLEVFVARIDCPVLTSFGTRFFNQLIFELPQLSQFVSRVDRLKSIREVVINPMEKYGNIALIQRGSRGPRRAIPEEFYFSISCVHLDWQLSSLSQILNQISPILSAVRVLSIRRYAHYPIACGKEDVDPAQFLELFQPLSCVSEVRVTIEEFVPNVVHALVSEDMATGLLPDLTSLSLEGYRKSPPVMEEAERFVATRKLAGRNVSLIA